MIVVRYKLNTKLTVTEYEYIRTFMNICKYLTRQLGDIETMLMTRTVCNKIIHNMKMEKIEQREH